MLETLIFQCSIAIAHKFDNFTNISKRLWDLVYVWSVLLSLKFQANTYSFERVVTLFVGYYFSSGHRVVISLLTNAISSSRGLTDVMLLSSYIHVRYVDISKNLIRDLTPLNGMTHLLTLNAEFNLLPVVSLEELPYLQKATFTHNQLENLNGFGHPLLESLNLSCKLFHVTYSLLKSRFY